MALEVLKASIPLVLYIFRGAKCSRVKGLHYCVISKLF